MAKMGPTYTGTWDLQTVSRFSGIRIGRVGYTGYKGSAAAPPIAFEEDPDTGIWSSGANSINFAAGGTALMGMTPVASDTSVPPTTAPRVYLLGGASGTDATAITPGATTTASVVEQTFTVTGLSTADTILSVNPPSADSATTWFIASYRVSGPNTLAIAFGSITGTPTPPASIAASAPWRVVAIRS